MPNDFGILKKKKEKNKLFSDTGKGGYNNFKISRGPAGFLEFLSRFLEHPLLFITRLYYNNDGHVKFL